MKRIIILAIAAMLTACGSPIYHEAPQTAPPAIQPQQLPSIDTASINFGAVQIYNPVQHIVRITNTSNDLLTVESLSFTGADAAMFGGFYGELPAIVAPGATFPVHITYTPSRVGSCTAIAEVVTSGAAFSVAVGGRGI